MKREKLHITVEAAIMLALATVLSLIRVYKLPLGGSITPVSMLPVCIIGLRHGRVWGFAGAFVYSVIQLMLDIGEAVSWGFTPVILIACILLDYVLAYTALGICGFFKGKSTAAMCVGVILSMLARFVCHLLSGVILFANWCPEGWNLLVYSVVYNGSFMLPEAILTSVAVIILSKAPKTSKHIFKSK